MPVRAMIDEGGIVVWTGVRERPGLVELGTDGVTKGAERAKASKEERDVQE